MLDNEELMHRIHQVGQKISDAATLEELYYFQDGNAPKEWINLMTAGLSQTEKALIKTNLGVIRKAFRVDLPLGWFRELGVEGLMDLRINRLTLAGARFFTRSFQKGEWPVEEKERLTDR